MGRVILDPCFSSPERKSRIEAPNTGWRLGIGSPEIFGLLTEGDDQQLTEIVSLLLRRRAAGFSPALLVSVNERHEVVSDAYLGREDAEELIAFLHQGGFADGAELETDGH